MKRLVGVLCLVAFVGGGLAWLVGGDGGGRGEERAASVPESEPAGERGRGAGVELDPAGPWNEARPAVAVVPPPSREHPRLTPVSGTLAEPASASPALLTWTPLLPELDNVRYLQSVDFERLRALTVATTSEAGSAFHFPGVPELAATTASVVWITQPGREARCVPLEPAQVAWRWPAGEAAPERAPVRVVVRRGAEPVAGARVRHTLSFWEEGQSEADKRPRRVFLRDLVTGPDGSATIVPGSGENALVASEGAERSFVWIGTPADTPESEIALELHPTIEVAGSVVTDDPELALDTLRYSVGYFSAKDRSDLVILRGSLGVHADGAIGPDLWPRGEATQLWVYVQGDDIVPALTTQLNPAPGARARVELRVTRGHPFVVAVADPAGAPIPGATVQAGHWSGTDWLGLAAEHSGADGRATVQAPAGPLYVEVTKEGFTAQMVDDARALVPQAVAPLAIVLRPAGVIAGLVHHGDEPVKRFTLAAWNDSRSYVRERALEDAEGAFQLADVPRGETIHLLAYSDALPQSDTAVVTLGDEPCEVELELPAPHRARGRVIDSLTREPVATATIQHLTSGMDGLATHRGAPMGVRADGGFELDGFCPGRGGFVCAAEGYETLYYHTRQDEAETIDIGLMVLHPLALLEVQVREAGVTDFGGYFAWNRGNFDGQRLPLASDGTLSLPSRTGPFELSVARPDGSVAWVRGLVLPGEHRRVELDLSRGIELAVGLAETPADVAALTLSAFSSSRAGERSDQARWSGEREAFVLHGLEAGDVVLELRDAQGALRVQRSLRLTDAAAQSFTLPLAGERRRVRLVDGRGRPWASRPVIVSLGDASGWADPHETDAQGEFELGPLDARRVVLSAKLGSESIAYGVPVELEPEPARTTTVVLEVGPRSLLRLMEEGRALAGVSVAYKHDRAPSGLEFGYSSDDAGLVRGPFLSRGNYLVRVNHSRYWPTRHVVSASESSEPLALELYSRANLALQVTDLAGQPLAGARLELRHVELGQSVADWLEAGLLVSPTGLTTDAAGRLALAGLPRGTYVWICHGPQGSSAAGERRIAAGESAELVIRLDER